MKVISLLAAALLQMIPLAAQTAGVADDVDVAEMLFGHIGDSYGWHITDWKGKHVTIPLPCIVKSRPRPVRDRVAHLGYILERPLPSHNIYYRD